MGPWGVSPSNESGQCRCIGREPLLEYGRVDRSRRTQRCLFLERSFGLGWLVRSLADLQPSARPPKALAPLPTTPRSPVVGVPNTGKYPAPPASHVTTSWGAPRRLRSSVLPGLDVAAVSHNCEQRVPPHAPHQVRSELVRTRGRWPSSNGAHPGGRITVPSGPAEA